MSNAKPHGGHEFSRAATIDPAYKRTLNPDYDTIGSKYAHIVIWEAHHRLRLDKTVFIIHHKNEKKRDNTVCDTPAPCPILNCGNLAPMTRRDHILEHRPGKMSGQKGLVDTKPRKKRTDKPRFGTGRKA